MILERIVGIANKNVEAEFLAMERSLRKTGCDVPLDVIPYDDNLFSLPANAKWWDEPVKWVKKNFPNEVKHPFQYRIYLLSCTNFQVADSDVIFLRNPVEVLAPYDDLVTACHQWSRPQLAASEHTLDWLKKHSSTWSARVFNAGQFALGGPRLFDLKELTELLHDPVHSHHVFDSNPPWDQGGFNYLFALTKRKQINLTLPPFNMESTWAADYPVDFCCEWESEEQTPYLIHWAGSCLYQKLAINSIFESFLSDSEKKQLDEKRAVAATAAMQAYRKSLFPIYRPIHDLKQLVKQLDPRLAERFPRRSR
jgi:hypothetical protein